MDRSSMTIGDAAAEMERLLEPLARRYDKRVKVKLRGAKRALRTTASFGPSKEYAATIAFEDRAKASRDAPKPAFPRFEPMDLGPVSASEIVIRDRR